MNLELRAIYDLTVRLSFRLGRLMNATSLACVLRREYRVAHLLARMELEVCSSTASSVQPLAATAAHIRCHASCHTSPSSTHRALRLLPQGLPIDPTSLRKHTEAIKARLQALNKLAEALLKGPVNLGSAQQVSEALHVQLKLPKPSRSDAAAKATHGSTSEVHLKELERRFPACPLPAWVLEHRELNKLLGTFLEPLADRAVLPDQRDQLLSRDHVVWPPVSGARLHTHWCQFATGTGRLSSRNPNVQQVPKHATKLATDVTSPAAADPATGPSAAAPPSAAFTQPATVSVRSSFVAAPGVVFLSADYSQLEMRLMAQLSNDPRLQLELHAGGDLFRRVAGAWHRKAPEAISELERGHTKQLCYGLTYGLGVERMAASMQLTVPEAVQLRKGFLSSFPTLAQFTEHVRKLARTNLAVATLCGRKRPLPGITSENSSERAKAERQAVNSVVQVGPSADDCVTPLRPPLASGSSTHYPPPTDSLTSGSPALRA